MVNVTNTDKEQEHSYRAWLRRQYTAEGIRRYTDNAVVTYSYALHNALVPLEPYVKGNLFMYKTSEAFEEILKQLENMTEYKRISEERDGTLRVAIELYKAFLSGGDYSDAPDITNQFYITKGESAEGYNDDRGEAFHYDEVEMTPRQKIFYGAPGTGKSYTVNQMIEEVYPDDKEREAHVKRLIFHPAYDYEDLVGGIRPLLTPDGSLEHVFVAGPLTMILKDAFMNPSEEYYLIIEEINRGNTPAIFGDLFQLLDRKAGGRSRYAIANNAISSYFARDPGLKKLFSDGKIWFPPNFSIMATMNTADENIYVLDNAFKRRFTLEYVRIRFDHLPDEWTKSYETFAGSRPLTAVFQDTPLENFVNELAAEGKLFRNWATYARLANKVIDMVNKEAARASDNEKIFRIAENKKLGPFFVSEADLSDRSAFINKVIFYLKQDVFPTSNHYMLDSFEEIFIKYQEGSQDLFELLR